MKCLFILVLISTSTLVAYDYVDLVGTDSELYVAWDDHIRIWGTSTERVFPSSCYCVSLGLAILNGADVLLYTRCHMEEPDTLYILDKTSLETVVCREILPEHLANLSVPPYAYMDVRLARHQPSAESFYLSADPSIICSGAMENNVVSARLEYDETDGIVIVDTLGYGFIDYVGSFSGLTGPVFCGTSLPMIFWSFYGSYFYASLCEYAAIHMIDGDPVPNNYEPILKQTFYSAAGAFTSGAIKCSGASEDEVVILWTTEDNAELNYSVYDCTCATELYEAPMMLSPVPEDVMSLSRNPGDEGMLLVWAEDNEIRCRYRDGVWNPWAYTIESITGTVGSGSIKVCGVSDGYWVAWRTYEKAEPEVRFVPRAGVMSIAESAVTLNSYLEVYPNPCSMSASIQVTGENCTGTVFIYSLDGRLVGKLYTDGNGSVNWNTESVSQGTYFVHFDRENTVDAVKLVVFH